MSLIESAAAAELVSKAIDTTILVILGDRVSAEKQRERLRTWIETMKSSPIAIATSEANEQHYEVPTEFFRTVLGDHLKYSSCYFLPHETDYAASLSDAERRMLELTVERAGIRDGDRILELGCGWGSLSLFMAARFPNARIVGVSNSRTQKEFIDARAKERGLDNLEIRTRDVNVLDFPEGTRFDRVVTVQDPTNPNRMVPAIVNSKGDLEPFHTFEKEAKPDPNAPKPLDPVKVREQHEKAYDAAFKTLIRPDAQGNPVPPKDEEVMQYLQRRKAAVDAIMSGQPMPGQWTQPTYNEDGTRAAPAPAPMQSPTAPLTEVGSAITGTQPSQQIPPPPSPNQPAIKQAGNTIKFGESDLPVRMSIPLQDGGNMPIVDVKMHGKYLSATPSKNGDGMLLLRRGEGGEILTIGQIKSPNSGTVEDPIVAPDKATWDYLEEAFPNGTWITDGIDRYQLKKPD